MYLSFCLSIYQSSTIYLSWFVICITNYPRRKQLTTTTIFTLSWLLLSQESGSGLAGWFWFSSSHEVAVQLLTKAAVSEDSPGPEGSFSKLRRISRALFPPHMDLFIGLSQSCFSWKTWRKRKKRRQRTGGRELARGLQSFII